MGFPLVFFLERKILLLAKIFFYFAYFFVCFIAIPFGRAYILFAEEKYGTVVSINYTDKMVQL